MEDLPDLDSLSLLDAIVLRVEVDWPRGTCSIALQGALRPGAMGGAIHWSGVTEVSLRRGQAEGSSDSVLAAHSTGAADEITMQWGGLIRIVAARRQVSVHFHAV